ncbi:MAG: gamma-glutamyl-gamma-aminobutyrate hydrolase family protein, partial [Armatimonadetes bacterium]|nr:gamma-glutamyl-gamma-aminobutyrate hydrolase family protein [Armatimonadota bacterium]
MTGIGPTSSEELVIILDFGGQYTQLIARRVRECRVYCEIMSFDTPLNAIKARSPKAIVLSGGPASVYEKGAPRVDTAIYELGIPVLGICYGAQLMAYQLGGKVIPGENREYGRTELEVIDPDGLFAGLDRHLLCW